MYKSYISNSGNYGHTTTGHRLFCKEMLCVSRLLCYPVVICLLCVEWFTSDCQVTRWSDPPFRIPLWGTVNHDLSDG